MKAVKLYATSYIDFPGRGYASYITSKAQLKTCHFHDYYEIFLVDQGYGVHQVNGVSQNIATGFLCFTRPPDIHYYDGMSEDFRIINIIIPETVIDSLFAFLGEEFGKERLVTTALPPSIQLDFSDLTSLIRELEQLILYKKIMKGKSDTAYRITIFNILTKYFSDNQLNGNSTPIPQWLRWLSLEMLKKDNFTKGLPALHRLSGKSPEHLSRACKRFLNKTPSKLINDIRLEYAAKRLITTDIPVIEISDECGFESLSYFYHRFKEHYGMSPKEFRIQGKERETQIYLMGELSVKAEIPASIPLDVGKKLNAANSNEHAV